MNDEKFLPIGTVVMLKNGTKRTMITGFCVTPDSNKTKTYDYCGCLYPEGVIRSNQVLLFDHEQIDKVYHMGLIDEEEQNFKAKLKEVLIKVNANSKEKEEKTEEIEILP